MLNKVMLIGSLGRDPETRQTQSGADIVHLNVATSERWKNKDGEKQERTEWHRVVIFNEGLGKIANQYLRKGSKVYLEGQIQTRKWTDKEGVERYSTEIVMPAYRGQLVLLDGAKSEEPQPERGYSQRREPARGGDLNDSIPF